MSTHRRQQGTQQSVPDTDASERLQSGSGYAGGPGNAALAEQAGAQNGQANASYGPSQQWGDGFWELETGELEGAQMCPEGGLGAGALDQSGPPSGGDDGDSAAAEGEGEQSQLDGNVGGGGGGDAAAADDSGSGDPAPAVQAEGGGGGEEGGAADGDAGGVEQAAAGGGGEQTGEAPAPAEGGGGGGMPAPLAVEQSDGGGGGDLGVSIDNGMFNVSTPDSPVIDDLILQSTGMSIDDHLAEDQLCIDELDQLGRDLQSSIGQQTDGVDIPAIDGLAATQTQSIQMTSGEAVSSLDDQTALTSGQIMSSADQATGLVQTQGDAAVTTLLSSEEGAVTDLQSRYQQFVSDAEALQTDWEGRFRARIIGGKAEIEAYANEIAAAQRALGEGASASGSGSALAQAKSAAGAEAEKKKRESYADSIVAYGRTAMDHLEQNADQDTVLGGNLLAPTIEQARPEMEAHEQQIRASARERERELYHAQREAQACIDTSAQAETDHLTTQQTEAASFLDQTAQSHTEQIEGARASMEGNTSESADAIHSAANQGHTDLHTLVSEVDGVIDSRALRTFTDEQTSAIEADRSAALQSLEGDRSAQTDDLDASAQECVDETTTAAQDQAARISEGGNLVSEDLVSSATDAGTDLLDAAGQTTEGMNTAGDQLAEGLSSSTEQVHGESEAQLARYDLMVQSYVNHAKAEIDRLVGFADTAATSARTAAESAKAQDIAQRSDKAFRAIDGMGTDESALRSAIFGVSAIEGQALEEDYETNADDYDRSDYSSYLRYDIDDDTSGSLQRGLIAALNGDKVGAAMELAQVRDFWGNTDAESTLSELRLLNEEERTQLLNHPEFPAIRDQVAAKMTMETGQLIGGANRWELDQFLALTDVERSREEAHARADAVKLMEAYEGSILNPTDEATAYAVMGQYKESMDLLEQEFAGYASERRLTIEDEEGLGQLTMHARDEMSREELDRAEALIDGDTARARAAEFQYAARRGEEQDAFTALENKNMDAYREGENGAPASGDFLAQLDARNEQTEMQSDWVDEYAGTQVYVENGYDEYGNPDYDVREVNSMEEMIDARFDNRRGQDNDRREDDIMHQLLDNGQADAELWMAYGIAGAGTREKYVTKALEQLRSSRTRPEDLQQMRDFLRENYGIDDLEAELGLGEHRGEWWTELGGQDAFEADQIFQEVIATDNDVDQMYDRAMMTWEHYRDPATHAGLDLDELESRHAAGELTPDQERLVEMYQIRREQFNGTDGLLDGFTRSDEVLDTVMANLNELYETRENWTTMREVGGRQSRQPVSPTNAQFLEFKALVDRVTRAGNVYRDQRQAIMDNITMAVQIIGAVLITAVTAGGALTAVGGMLASMALGTLTIAFKAAVLGPGYGYDAFLADLGKVVADAILSVGANGLGSRYAGWNKIIEDNLFANYPKIMKAALTEAVGGLPGETVNTLFDERVWDGDNPGEAIVGALAIGTVRNFASGLGSGAIDQLNLDIEPEVNRYLSNISSNVMGVLGDYNIMSGDDVGFELLKAVGTGTMSAALTNATVQHVADRINREGDTATNRSHLYDVSDGARQAVMAKLDPSVLATLPDSLLVGGGHTAFASDRLDSEINALHDNGHITAADRDRLLAIDNVEARRTALGETERFDSLADRTLSELDERHGHTDDPVEVDTPVVETGTTDVVTDADPTPTSATTDSAIQELNTLSDDDLRARLVAIDGIGPATADAIIAARADGPFANLSDLMLRVNGVGPVRGAAIHAGIEDELTIGGRTLVRTDSGWQAEDGSAATEAELTSLRQRLTDEGNDHFGNEMDKVAYAAHVEASDTPLEVADWEVRRRAEEDFALAVLSNALESDAELLARARAGYPAVGDGGVDALREALDAFKADGQFSSTNTSDEANVSAYDLSGFEDLVLNPRSMPNGPWFSMDTTDRGNDGVGRPGGVAFIAPLGEAMDMNGTEYARALGITTGRWQESQEQLQGFLDQAQSEGRSASWAREQWNSWVESSEGPGFKNLDHITVLLDTDDLLEEIRYTSRHKASGVTEATRPSVEHDSDIPRVVAVQLNAGETLGDGVRRALSELVPDRADAIAEMSAEELSEVIESLGSGAHRTR